MDEKIIEKLINSDELISRTIEENSQSSNKMIDEFSSIMSMSTINGEQLEKIIKDQGEKEAENIKSTFLKESNKTSELPLQTITEIESSKLEGGVLSNETINNLIDVISSVQNVLDNLQLQNVQNTTNNTLKPLENNIEEPINKVEIPNVNLENISQVIDDFKTLSTLNWCKDWFSCLEKIIEQADIVKEALGSIPTDNKIALGINEEELEKIDSSIEKVKENITTDINLSLSKSEIIEEQASSGETPQSSNQFLNNSSEITEKISSITNKIENNTISQESFINKVNQFSEETIKTIENTFNKFSENSQNVIEKTSTVENLTNSSFKTELVNIEKLSANPQLENPSLLGEITKPVLTLEQPTAPTVVETTPTIVSPQTPIEAMLALEEPTATTVVEMLEATSEQSKSPKLVETLEATSEQSTTTVEPSNNLFDNLMKLIPNLSTKGESEERNKNISFENISSTSNTNTPISNLNLEKKEVSPLNFENLLNFEEIFQSTNQNEIEKNLSVKENPIKFENILPNNLNLLQKNLENPLMQFSSPLENKQLDLNDLGNNIISNNFVSNSSVENVPMSNVTESKSPIQLTLPSNIKSGIESTTNNIGNVEDMLIRNQEIPQINIANAASRLETNLPEPTSKIVASSESMSNEVDLQPLGNQISSSISALNDNISSSKNTTENTVQSQNNQETTTVMNDILIMLKKLDKTLEVMSASKPTTNSMPSLGGSIGDSQARAIGRQIAYELKDSLSRLYN